MEGGPGHGGGRITGSVRSRLDGAGCDPALRAVGRRASRGVSPDPLRNAHERPLTLGRPLGPAALRFGRRLLALGRSKIVGQFEAYHFGELVHGRQDADQPPSRQEALAGRTSETQFGRALRELGIDNIPASSPQAKGRVERSFGTEQDRLVKELRLRGTSDVEAANAYLEAEYIPWRNGRFSVRPARSVDAHRSLQGYVLKAILSVQATRTVTNDYTVRYRGQALQIEHRSIRAGLRKAKVIVEQRLDGSVKLRWRGRYLRYHRACHSSLISIDDAVTSRRHDGPSGKTRTTRVRRFSSWCHRSRMFAERIRLRCGDGARLRPRHADRALVGAGRLAAGRAGGRTFTVTQGDASLVDTVVAPAGAALRLVEPGTPVAAVDRRGNKTEKKLEHPALWVEARPDQGRKGGDDFFVLMTRQRGEAPKPAVDGKGLAARVRVGKRTVRFDGKKVLLE